jgi:hypothetical protein
MTATFKVAKYIWHAILFYKALAAQSNARLNIKAEIWPSTSPQHMKQHTSLVFNRCSVPALYYQ